MPGSNQILLSELEFTQKWDALHSSRPLYEKLTYLIRSEKPEIQDFEGNSERGLKIMAALHEANVQMRFYDLLVHRFSSFIDQTLDGKSSVSVLEIGTGHGHVITHVAKVLSNLFDRTEFYGMDINQAFIDCARENCFEEGGEVSFFCGDARNLGEAVNGKYDYILMSIFIHHLKPYELYRLLACVVPFMERGLFIIDVRRDLLNILKSKLLSIFNPAYSRDFKKDAIQSMRRAYTVRELEWLLGIVPGLAGFSVEKLDGVFLSVEGRKA